jgi:hypothetical protein
MLADSPVDICRNAADVSARPASRTADGAASENRLCTHPVEGEVGVLELLATHSVENFDVVDSRFEWKLGGRVYLPNKRCPLDPCLT